MASNARSSSGGVRNLRAMFETSNSTAEDSTSPPPRGRSPAGESVVSNGSAGPLSTVRTSFVAVERSGQLKKINGDGGVEGKVDVKIGVLNKDKPKEESAEATANGKNSKQGNNTVGEATEKPVSSGGEQKPALPANTKGKAAVYDSVAPKEQSSQGVGEPKEAAALSAAEIPLPDTPKPAEKSKTPMSTKNKAPMPAKGSSEKGKEKSTSTEPAVTTKSKEKPPRSSLAPISGSGSRATTAVKPTVKAPTLAQAPATKPTPKLPKTPTTPSKPSHSTMATSKPRAPPATTTEPTKAPTKKPSRPSMVPSTAGASSSAPKPRNPPSSSSAPLSKPALQPSPRSKAPPRSPTRPARLPTSITAPTASSAAKTSNNPPSRPHSRSSSSGLQRQRSAIQKVSPARPTTTASVRRQPSRPSLPDRPHSRNAAVGRKSLSGSTVAPDDGFLTRMMRPTASSASKTLEKAQDKAHEKGDSKVARKVKNVNKGITKSGGESAVPGEEKKDQHREQVEEAGTRDSKDAGQDAEQDAGQDTEQDATAVAAKEIEQPMAHEGEVAPAPGKVSGAEGDDNISEDAPPVSAITELPEVTPIVAAAE